ncbi:MAG: rod shape-determining protein MreC [Bacteroidales bacterium]|nr:rod shape-determining protein MreC [Bacteroidales bacterium]
MRIPPSLYQQLGRVLLFIAIEAICIAMVVNNGIVQQYTVCGEIREIQRHFWEVTSNLKNYSRLREINRSVTMQNIALMEENSALREYLNNTYTENTADSLTRLYTAEHPQFEYNWAKVIKNTINTQHNFIIINKGSKDGIMVDMGVITPNGVVGIVRAVSRNNAYVLSFLNNKQQISAKIGKSNTFGQLAWDGKDILFANLNDIPQHVDANPGDTIYTSGYSSFFPPDIPIGTAESSKIVNGMHRSVRVKLLQDFSLLDNVIIVKNNYHREIDSLSNIVINE